LNTQIFIINKVKKRGWTWSPWITLYIILLAGERTESLENNITWKRYLCSYIHFLLLIFYGFHFLSVFPSSFEKHDYIAYNFVHTRTYYIYIVYTYVYVYFKYGGERICIIHVIYYFYNTYIQRCPERVR